MLCGVNEGLGQAVKEWTSSIGSLEAWGLEGFGRGPLGSWANPGLGPESSLNLSSSLRCRAQLPTKASMWCFPGVEPQHMSMEVAAGGVRGGRAGRTGMPTLRHLGLLKRLGTACP